MAFVPDTGPGRLRNGAWMGIGTVLLILILGALFFIFASGRARRNHSDREPPPDNRSTTSPGPVIAH